MRKDLSGRRRWSGRPSRLVPRIRADVTEISEMYDEAAPPVRLLIWAGAKLTVLPVLIRYGTVGIPAPEVVKWVTTLPP